MTKQHILSVSISSNELKFIKEGELSPSKLLQMKINELYNSYREIEKLGYKEKFDRAYKNFHRALDFIKIKGLSDEFSNFMAKPDVVEQNE